MATINRLMAVGLPGSVANHLGQNTSTSIVAAGTSAGNATGITGSFTIVTTAPANTGIILKNAGGMPETVIYNGGINTMKLYPAAGEKINNGAANAAFSVTAGKTVMLIGTEGAWIANLSA